MKDDYRYTGTLFRKDGPLGPEGAAVRAVVADHARQLQGTLSQAQKAKGRYQQGLAGKMRTTLPGGILVETWINPFGLVPTLMARVTFTKGENVERTYIMEDGWLAWELVPTAPTWVYPEYPLTLYSPYYLSHKPSDVWINNTAPAVPNIEPRKYTGLTRLLAQAMVGAKRAWSAVVPGTMSTTASVFGVQRNPRGDYWLFNASRTLGIKAVKLEIPDAGRNFQAVLLDSNATDYERHEAEARLFGTVELPLAAPIVLVSPEDYVAACDGGPLQGGWHWMYQQGFGQTRAGAIAVHQTQMFSSGFNGGFVAKEYRLEIFWDPLDNFKPVVTIESEDEQKWLHYKSNLHLWLGFGSQWDEIEGTEGGNPIAETEYLEGDANIYARYDTDDSVIYTGITGSRKVADGTPAPEGADEANTFLQQIVFCGGTGSGSIVQEITGDEMTLQAFWDGEPATGTIQQVETYTWEAAGGTRSQVFFDPVGLGDSVDLVNCSGTTTHYGYDDADPQTNIGLKGRWDASNGSWSKRVQKSIPSGDVCHLFLGDDVDCVAIVKQTVAFEQDAQTGGAIQFAAGVGSILFKGAETIDHFTCQIFGYIYWPGVNAVCRTVTLTTTSNNNDTLKAVYSDPLLTYRWPGGQYEQSILPDWVDEFAAGTIAISAAPYMNSSYGGLMVATDYIPPKLEPEAVDNFGCWEGGT